MLHVIEFDELEVSSFDLKVMGSVMSQVIDHDLTLLFENWKRVL